MITLDSVSCDSSEPTPEKSHRKIIVGGCLFISLMIHVVAIALVLMASTQHGYGPSVTYIDINSIAESAPSVAPVIHAPARKPYKEAEEQAVPMAENAPDITGAEPVVPPVVQPVPEVLATSLGRSMASGYFSSFAEGKNLRDDIREYYFVLMEKINSNWWLKAETLRESAPHDGVVMFVIGRDGALVDTKLQKSTGSSVVDMAITEVLKEGAPYPPLPDSFPLARFMAPLKITAPLRLFSVRSQR